MLVNENPYFGNDAISKLEEDKFEGDVEFFQEGIK